jgi:ArsR family transcriptional regulator, virulence genes transcriptional regulator
MKKDKNSKVKLNGGELLKKAKFAVSCVMTLNLKQRADIIGLLEEKGTLNVGQIFKKLKYGQAETSHHLKLLKTYGVVGCKRYGQEIHYFLNKERLKEILKAVDTISFR